MRIFIISGSGRRQYNCPGVDSKSRALMFKMKALLPSDWEIDVEDLGNVFGRARIQSCNACVSTAMSLCVWPCNCYEKNNSKEPDLMWDLDMYSRFDQADAWAIIGPVNWYGPTSNLKLMFDRLVCMNGGNPKEELIDHKNPELAMKLEHQPEWKDLSLNHLEGRTAGFFCYGDGGGDEMDEAGRPKILRHKNYFNAEQEPFKNMRDAYAPFVWQCRYGGIEVPNDLWKYHEFGKGKKYSDNQAEDMIDENDLNSEFHLWVSQFRSFVGAKGKVQPGKFRAYGYEAPGHKLADVKLKWRELRMSSGHAPQGSSPRIQDQMGLNKDATFSPAKSTQENN
ncbi:MAG: flavodoxin family protein [Moraxellaceae bacterium]|nr:flavodoxin family protein [Pseudobdellovibrionaceae bacterium]